MPALATDNFNRANEAPLTGNWSQQSGEGTMNLTTNHVATPADNQDLAENYNAVTWPNDQYSQAVLTATTGFSLGDGPGLGLRMATAATTYYRIIISHITGGNNVQIAKKVSGTYTSIANRNSGAWTDGATWYAEIQGSAILVKLNGAAVGTSATDSSITTGRAGITYSSEGGSQSATWDDWEGGNIAAAGQDTPELYGRPEGNLGQRQMHQLLSV